MSSNRILTGTISRPSCSFSCQISDSLFDVWFSTCRFYPSDCDITRPPSFRKSLLTAEERCMETGTFSEHPTNWEVSPNRILTGTIRGSSCSFICVKLVIHYLTCGFRPVISTGQNLISRGPPIFGSFCKPLRNVLTETFSEKWEVSSNRILTGRPFGTVLYNVKLVTHYLMYGF